jgi:hypothetical protein
MAAVKYHISGMYSCSLAPENKQKEWELIQTIARSNIFPQNRPQKLNWKIQHSIDRIQTEEKDK